MCGFWKILKWIQIYRIISNESINEYGLLESVPAVINDKDMMDIKSTAVSTMSNAQTPLEPVCVVSIPGKLLWTQ